MMSDAEDTDAGWATPKAQANDEIVATAKEQHKLGLEAEADQRQRELDDIRFHNGEHWPTLVKEARKAVAAPAK